MPYDVVRRDGQWCVRNSGTGALVPGGCHGTEGDAQRHMAALYANEPAARTGACSCGGATLDAWQAAPTHPQAEVNYRPASNNQRCGVCAHFIEPAACALVEGTIGASMTCDLWAASPRVGASTSPLSEPFPVPAYPPADWFSERPDWLEPGMKLTVDDHGRVAGYFYDAGQCLVHDPSGCPRPSPTGYQAFHQQDVIVDNGDTLRVGVIGNVGGHASPYAPITVAMGHYANPNLQLMVGRAYDDEHGGYFLGSLTPTHQGRPTSYGDVALVRRSALSGDWRPMPAEWWQANEVPRTAVIDAEGYDCIGPTLVTRPGLPLVRRFQGAAGVPSAVLGGTGGVQLDDQEDRFVPKTRTTLPGGIVIESDVDPATVGAPGPRPARTAADAGPPPAPDAAPADNTGGDSSTLSLEQLSAIAADHEQRLATVEQWWAEMVQGMEAQVAMEAESIRASLEVLPEPLKA